MSLYSGLGGGAGPSAHSDILTANPAEPSSQRALVEEIKRRGRACVLSKNYPDADALYGKGIDVLSAALKDENGGDEKKEDAATGGADANRKDLAVFHSNRSLVRMQMSKVAEALEDAEAAVRVDPTYVKAHWRRGQASSASGNAAEALASFERALALEPNNKALKREVEVAKKRKEEEERSMREAAEAAAAGGEGGDGGAADAEMKDAPKTTKATSTTKKPTVGTKKPSSSSSSAQSTVKQADEGEFTKSDHVRGYKIRSDGKKTSYFDREISDDAKKLIGDIAPKKLDAAGGGGGDFAPKPLAAASEGKSAWNTAGTWEERNVTDWAIETLTASLLSAAYELPDGSPAPGARATVSKVSKIDGHASYATVRGKKKYIYEFSIAIKWELDLGERGTCKGEVTFPDVDGTVELGEGYDIVKYSVDASSPAGTGPLLDRFVRDGGLRESVHKAIDDWVRLFRATY